MGEGGGRGGGGQHTTMRYGKAVVTNRVETWFVDRAGVGGTSTSRHVSPPGGRGKKLGPVDRGVGEEMPRTSIAHAVGGRGGQGGPSPRHTRQQEEKKNPLASSAAREHQ